MNNHQEWAYNSPYPRSLYQQSSEDSSAVTRVTTTIALLVLGYYAFNFFELWPSTLKRRAYETFVDLFPAQLIVLMQSIMMRLRILSRESTRFKLENLTSRQAKSDVLRELLGFENNRITTVVRKARTLSGIDNILPLSTEIGPAGLGNWDNSCYQNSVLHGFASLPAFNYFVSKSLDLMRQKGTTAPTHEALVSFLGKLNASDQPKRTLWTPAVLKSMDSWQQQDAQEYFSRVLDAVEKEDVRFYKTHRTRDGLERLPRAGDLKESRTETISSAATDIVTTATAQPDRHPMSNETSEAYASRSTAGLPERNPLDGMLAQSLKCRACGFTEGLSLTQFNCITVNLGTAGSSCTLEQLLDEYTEPEDIDGVECTQCTKLANTELTPVEDTAAQEQEAMCSHSDALTISESLAPSSVEPDEHPSRKSPGKKLKPVLSTKSKQLTIGRLPEDLVIHLNRSIFDMYGSQRKNTAPVDFPLRLSILSRWCAPLDDIDGRTIQAAYALQCIVTHAGRHDDGHYIAYAKRDKDWYCFNDEVVTKVSEGFVLSRGNAFMLFYEVDNSLVSGEETAEPPVLSEDIFKDASMAALIEKRGAEDTDTANEVPSATSEVMVATAEAEAPAHPSTASVLMPHCSTEAMMRMESDDDTVPSSTATSDADIEEKSQADTRLETKLPPMRTASESSSIHRRMESSHAAPVF